MSNLESVLELYTAYFGRAADKAGVDYWLNEMDTNGWTLDQVAQSFADQVEYQEDYAGKNNSETVTAIYNNLLGRAPDSAGLAYWVAELNNGNIKIEQMIKAIIDGAQGNDIVTIDNKTAVSAYAYEQGSNNATLDLSSVTADPTTIQAQKDKVDLVVEAQNGVGTTVTFKKDEIDVFEGKAGNDTIIATQETLEASDLITDESIYDTDTLNYKTTSDNTPLNLKAHNIEVVNIELTKNSNATIDVTSLTHEDEMTINVSATSANFTGKVSMTGVLAAHNIVVDNKVKDLTLNANGKSITTAGDIKLTLVAADATIKAAAGSTIELSSTSAAFGAKELKIIGDNVTLKATSAQLTTTKVTGASKVILTTAATADLSQVEADEIVVDAATTAATTIDLAKDANVTFTKAQTFAVVVDGENATINAKEGFSASLKVNQNSKIVVDTKDIIIASLIGAAGKTISFEGSKNVTITTTTTAATNIDASALTGELNIVAVAAAAVDVIGGTGKNTVVATAAGANDVNFTGNSNVDTLTVGTTSLVEASFGAGNDSLIISAAPAALTVDGGEGTDSITISSDISALSFANVTNFEKLILAGASTVSAEQIESFTLLNLSGTTPTALVIAAAGDDKDLNLSNLSVADKVNTTIDVTVTGYEKIKASQVKDFFTFDNTDEAVVEISNFTKTGDLADKIVIEDANTLYATNANAKTAVTNVPTDANAGYTALTADEVVAASVNDKGLLSLTLTTAGKAKVDTDDEIFALLKGMVKATVGSDPAQVNDTLAYVSGGNTYIVTSNVDATTFGKATANSIKLVGTVTTGLTIDATDKGITLA